jgi:hypothetical protein
MKNEYCKTLPNFLKTCLFIMIILCGLNYGQQVNRIFEEPGGGSNNTNTTVESNDNTFLYVAGAAVVVGIVVYALLKDKKEKSTKDTTSAILNDDFLEKHLSINERVANVQSQIPINISFGMQNDFLKNEDKRYYVGLNYNF